MYFPTADITCNPLLPFVAAFAVSCCTSMAGISGAFLLLPFQMSVLGYTAPGVSATNQVFNVVACPAGVWRYWREGRFVWPLAATVAMGTLPGVFIGAIARMTLLPDPRPFKVFAGLVLLYIGGRMAWGLIRERMDDWLGRPKTVRTPVAGGSSCRTLLWNSREIVLEFQEKEYRVAGRKLALLSFVVGVIGGTYGIGGGAIMAPFLVSFFGLPVYVVAGATLCATALTSLAGVSFFALLAWISGAAQVAPDWRLGLLLGLGGIIGMYLGARMQKFVPAFALKTMLVLVLLGTALRYLAQGV